MRQQFRALKMLNELQTKKAFLKNEPGIPHGATLNSQAIMLNALRPPDDTQGRLVPVFVCQVRRELE
jgi:hypothetical protein